MKLQWSLLFIFCSLAYRNIWMVFSEERPIETFLRFDRATHWSGLEGEEALGFVTDEGFPQEARNMESALSELRRQYESEVCELQHKIQKMQKVPAGVRRAAFLGDTLRPG